MKAEKPSVVYWIGNKLYLNITNRCSNNCYFCFRNFTHNLNRFNLRLKREPSPEEALTELQKVIHRKDWSEIVFCGFGEPLERLDCVVKITKWIKRYHGKPVRIDTNGQGFLLHKDRAVVEELKQAGVDKISVSLNAQDKLTYNKICRPSCQDAYESVRKFIERARTCKEFELEITAVTVPEVDISRIQQMAKEMKVQSRIRRVIPCFW